MTIPYVWTPNPERDALVREYNGLKLEREAMNKKLEKMEAHEGEDGTPEDIDGQCQLVDAIAVKDRRLAEIRKVLYPKA